MRTFSVSSLLLLLVCTAMLTACRPVEEEEAAAPGAGYNVAVILVDTLRPDHLQCVAVGSLSEESEDALRAIVQGALVKRA